tara:strand:- start:1172 stop:1372 length:201 start_codon:yes stop_codon:yes gene_type:complete
VVTVPVTDVALPATVYVQLTIYTAYERYRAINAEQRKNSSRNIIANRQYLPILQASNKAQRVTIRL